MKKETISYDKANMLSTLTRAYLNADPSVRSLFVLKPSIENVAKVVEKRQSNFPVNREVLVNSLKKQYVGFESNNQVQSNIESLRDENTFTITTGHQLNLFSGPLFFIYKIISVIESAKVLNAKYPNEHFVPVYWMATEDHDFDEINHTYVKGEKITWNSDETGMVGSFSTNGIGVLLEELTQKLGDDFISEEIILDFKNAYTKYGNLSDATRALVHGWFKTEGLVIMDANQRELKSLFLFIVKDELLNESSFKQVSATIENFPIEFKAQVAPREINLFYVKDGIRERIIKVGDIFEVNNTDIAFTKSEILMEVDSYPERFSPNVILRPLYQEVILPNVMYYGGGAEVSYWLELKSTFDYHQVSYPLVQIRNSFLILDANVVRKVLNCCLSMKELFMDYDKQVTKLLAGDNPFEETLRAHKKEVDEKIKALIDELEAYDPQLIKTLKSTKVGFIKELQKLDRKIMKSVKRKNAVKLDRLNAIRSIMFPEGVYQERRVNISDMLLKYGRTEFFELIASHTEPFHSKLTVLLALDE